MGAARTGACITEREEQRELVRVSQREEQRERETCRAVCMCVSVESVSVWFLVFPSFGSQRGGSFYVSRSLCPVFLLLVLTVLSSQPTGIPVLACRVVELLLREYEFQYTHFLIDRYSSHMDTHAHAHEHGRAHTLTHGHTLPFRSHLHLSHVAHFLLLFSVFSPSPRKSYWLCAVM